MGGYICVDCTAQALQFGKVFKGQFNQDLGKPCWLAAGSFVNELFNDDDVEPVGVEFFRSTSPVDPASQREGDSLHER